VTSVSTPSPRDRILHAALHLLETGGPGAVSTRSVSSAAGVQVPTIYRQFGDMPGLLDAVAHLGFEQYLERKREHTPGDPVDDLRAGWDRHVAFGMAHPHLYSLMYGGARSAGSARKEGGALLRAILERVAQTGRLALGVDRAATLLHAACLGLTLSLIGSSDDSGLSALTRETVLKTLLTPDPGGETSGTDLAPRQRAASHAVALGTLLPALDVPLSEAERALLAEWLRKLS